MSHYAISALKPPPQSVNPHDEMDPGVKEDLEYTLERNLQEIVTKYASYVDCLRARIQEKGIPPEELCSYLLSLPASSKKDKGQKLALLSEKKCELLEKKNITSIFTFLTTECASFLNYDIFQAITEKYHISEDTDELKYSEYLKEYVEKHKVSEFVKINPLLKKHINKTDSEKVILKLKFDVESTCSLAKVSELKKFVAKILDLKPSALSIIDIEKGCVIVTFHILPSIANAVFTSDLVFTPRQEDEFRAAEVLWLECNGYTFNFQAEKNQKKLKQDESPG